MKISKINIVTSPGMFRLILALMVMISHTLPIKLGATSVYLFFVLSGYWIHRMWHREYEPLQSPIATFYISRVWRIFPVTIFVLALLFLCAKPFGLWDLNLPPLRSFNAFHFYFSHVFLIGYASLDDAHKLIVPLWSLDNELQFYIISPFIIWMLARKKGFSLEKIVVLAIALLGIWFVAFRFGTDSTVGWVPNYLLFFMIGMVGASVEWKPSRVAVNGGIVLSIIILGSCLAMAPLRGIFLSGRFTSDIAYLNPIGNIIIGLLLAPYAIATTKNESTPLDRVLGNISFEIYLVHEAVLTTLRRFIGTSAGEPLHNLTLRYVVFAGLYILIVAISVAIYFYIDNPIDNARRRWMKSRLKKSASTGVPFVESGVAKSTRN